MAQRLTPLHPKKIEKKLVNLGFKFDHEDGSIRYYLKAKDGKLFVVQVHFHPKDKSVEIIQGILRNGGISRKEWLDS